MVFASGVSTDCLVTGCGELAAADGLCRSHYNRKAYSGRPVTPIRARVCPMCGMAFQLTLVASGFNGFWRSTRIQHWPVPPIRLSNRSL